MSDMQELAIIPIGLQPGFYLPSILVVFYVFLTMIN